MDKDKKDTKDTKSQKAEEKKGQTLWMASHAKEKDIEELMKRVPKKVPSVPDIILPRLGELDMSVEVMSELAGFNRATGYKIINGKQRAERDMLLRIAFVLEFDFEKASQLLKSGCRAALTSTSRRDVAIIYGLQNHLSLGYMDELLDELGLPMLSTPKKKSSKSILPVDNSGVSSDKVESSEKQDSKVESLQKQDSDRKEPGTPKGDQ